MRARWILIAAPLAVAALSGCNRDPERGLSAERVEPYVLQMFADETCVAPRASLKETASALRAVGGVEISPGGHRQVATMNVTCGQAGAR